MMWLEALPCPEPVTDVEIVWNKHIHMFAVAVLFGLIYVRTVGTVMRQTGNV